MACILAWALLVLAALPDAVGCPQHCDSCSSGFGPEFCNPPCAPGWYNPPFDGFCSTACPQPCPGDVCDYNTGSCVCPPTDPAHCLGCAINGTCAQCQNGWIGQSCAALDLVDGLCTKMLDNIVDKMIDSTCADAEKVADRMCTASAVEDALLCLSDAPLCVIIAIIDVDALMSCAAFSMLVNKACKLVGSFVDNQYVEPVIDRVCEYIATAPAPAPSSDALVVMATDAPSPPTWPAAFRLRMTSAPVDVNGTAHTLTVLWDYSAVNQVLNTTTWVDDAVTVDTYFATRKQCFPQHSNGTLSSTTFVNGTVANATSFAGVACALPADYLNGFLLPATFNGTALAYNGTVTGGPGTPYCTTTGSTCNVWLGVMAGSDVWLLYVDDAVARTPLWLQPLPAQGTLQGTPTAMSMTVTVG